MASREIAFSSVVYHPLLERNDRVVRDGDVLRTDLGAALGDVAIADPELFLERRHAIGHIQRMHLQRGGVDEVTRPDELVVLVMVAQHVTDVLAQEALDALPKLLHAIHVALVDSPCPVGRIRRPRREALNLRLHAVIPGDVRHEIAHVRKRTHGFHRHGLVVRQLVQASHAHELGLPIDLCRARAALARLAIPAHREIVCLLRLDLMHGVENDHAFIRLGDVVVQRAAAVRTAPQPEAARPVTHRRILRGLRRRVGIDRLRGCILRMPRHDCISVMIAANSSGMGGIGCRVSCMSSPRPRVTMWLNVPNAGSLSG